MHESQASKTSSLHRRGSVPVTPVTPVESPLAAWLQQGFPNLKFGPALEQEFRQVLRSESLPQVRRNLWLAFAFVVGFSLLTHMVIDPAVNRLMDLLRLAIFGPVLAVALLCLHLPRYQKIYPTIFLLGAPIFGVGVVVLAVIAARHGVNMISTVVLVTFYIYFMLGMLFWGAVISSTVVFASYVVSASLTGLPAPEMLIDLGVVFFANVMGAMVCYTLERANRTHFLEERLLIETASRDGLTGIHNRRVFDEHIDRIWPQAAREGMPLSLMLIDIDHFKAYNDYYGHQAGDECLKRVARCLTLSARRPLDITTRYGGEEFAIVLYDASREHVEEATRRIQAGMQAMAIEHLASPAACKRLTVSIGAACVMPQPARTHFGFIQLADEALYAAKVRGRDCAVIMDKEYEQLITGSFRKPGSSSGIAPAAAVNE
jgi:diguanylate cyclase (GGDEF)-like protein